MDETQIPRIQDCEGHLILKGIRLELEEAEDAHAYDSPASKVALLTSATEVLLSFNSQLSIDISPAYQTPWIFNLRPQTFILKSNPHLTSIVFSLYLVTIRENEILCCCRAGISWPRVQQPGGHVQRRACQKGQESSNAFRYGADTLAACGNPPSTEYVNGQEQDSENYVVVVASVAC